MVLKTWHPSKELDQLNDLVHEGRLLRRCFTARCAWPLVLGRQLDAAAVRSLSRWDTYFSDWDKTKDIFWRPFLHALPHALHGMFTG